MTKPTEPKAYPTPKHNPLPTPRQPQPDRPIAPRPPGNPQKKNFDIDGENFFTR